MAISRLRSKRKVTGGLYKKFRKKKKYELGGLASLTKLDEKKTRRQRGYGGKERIQLLRENKVNLFDDTSKKYKVVKILTVQENPANRHFVKRNIMNKGAVVKTEVGLAVITSRPGQDGVLNARLIKVSGENKGDHA